MKHMETGKIRLYYEESGAGPPLICIMGLSARGEVWKIHSDAWNQSYRVICADNRGVGLSDKPSGPYSTKQMAEDYLGLMDSLNIEKARIVGLSMGGAIAQEIAIMAPERVQSMILVSTWAKCDEYCKNIFKMFKTARGCLRCEEFMHLLQVWIFSKGMFNDNTKRQELSKGVEDARVTEHPQPLFGFEAQADACITHDTSSRLHEIKCPCLISHGKDDIFTPYWMAEELSNGIANGELFTFKNAGHAHHWEDPIGFHEKTLEWLSSN